MAKSSPGLSVGDEVVRYVHCLKEDEGSKKRGVVVYIHPKGRFHVVEFTIKSRFGVLAEGGLRSFRESYLGVSVEPVRDLTKHELAYGTEKRKHPIKFSDDPDHPELHREYHRKMRV